jgi:hypothetical protein
VAASLTTPPLSSRNFKTAPFIGRLTHGQIRKLAKAILAFSEFVCEIKLYPYQREFCLRIITSMLSEDTAEVSALFSRHSGKTEAVTLVIIWCIIIESRDWLR